MMAIECFGVFRNDQLMYAGMFRSRKKSENYAATMSALIRVFGFFDCFEVKPICWSAERGEFIAVPDSISI